MTVRSSAGTRTRAPAVRSPASAPPGEPPGTILNTQCSWPLTHVLPFGAPLVPSRPSVIPSGTALQLEGRPSLLRLRTLVTDSLSRSQTGCRAKASDAEESVLCTCLCLSFKNRRGSASGPALRSTALGGLRKKVSDTKPQEAAECPCRSEMSGCEGACAHAGG